VQILEMEGSIWDGGRGWKEAVEEDEAEAGDEKEEGGGGGRQKRSGGATQAGMAGPCLSFPHGVLPPQPAPQTGPTAFSPRQHAGQRRPARPSELLSRGIVHVAQTKSTTY
jgi:hypothetical protein